MDSFVDPAAAVSWPRSAGPVTLRLLEPGDVDAMHDFRRLPEVCRYLSHEPLTWEETRVRVESRLPGAPCSDERLVRGAAVLLDGIFVGDAMLRVSGEGLRIGYALRPDVWGQGIATAVARELVAIGHELGLDVWADVRTGNEASLRVLERAGLVEVARTDSHHELVARHPAEATAVAH